MDRSWNYCKTCTVYRSYVRSAIFHEIELYTRMKTIWNFADDRFILSAMCGFHLEDRKIVRDLMPTSDLSEAIGHFTMANGVLV